MNVEECANCLLHGWNQPQNLGDLQKCKRCKQVKYCGKECQTEHWKNLHKRQCRHFADLALAHQSNHNGATCSICLKTASVGKPELRNPTNPNYFCLYKTQEWKQLEVSSLHHAHPFPVTGQPGNTKEKIILVLWHLLYKFKHCQPKVAQMFKDGLDETLRHLLMERLGIWNNRKIYSQPGYFNNPDKAHINKDFWMTVSEAVLRRMSAVDPFQLCRTIELISSMAMDECLVRMMMTLKDPLNTLPTELRERVSRGLDNIPKYLAVVNQVLDALASEIIPFKDILKIICGGNLKQKCSFCSKEVIIAGHVPQDRKFRNGNVACFDVLFIGTFLCDACNCSAIRKPMVEGLIGFVTSVVTALRERGANRCDFCFLVSTAGDVHRCSRCKSKMYCNKTCQLEDWKIHKEVCKEDVEERKIKFGVEERKEEERENREDLKNSGNHRLKEACDMLEKLEFRKTKKKSRK